jgi:preprotein translocase subunit SecD
MWKKLLALAVTAGIIAGAMFLYRHRHTLFRPEFARTGGTVLVYEADGQPSPEDLEQAAAVLQRRFDPTGALGILVGVTDNGEIELRVPRSDKHDALVDQIKRLILQPGRMEIRVLARQDEDESAFAAAYAALKAPGAKDKVPPPPPDSKPAAAARLGGDSEYRYSWERLSPGEVQMLRLDPTTLAHGNPLDEPRVRQGLASGEAFTAVSAAPNLLFAVRRVPGEKDPVFFVLTRQEPESRRITGEDVERTWVIDAARLPRPSVSARFTREGGDRLFALTSRNLTAQYTPEGPKRLALLLDGEVISTPWIQAALRKDAQFPGDFTRAQAEDLAVVLRGGACQVRLKPGPLRETSVGGK